MIRKLERNPDSTQVCSLEIDLQFHSGRSDKARMFLQKTQEHVLQGINPGGIYQAIWCRDAAYILRDWFLSGNIDATMQQIYQIWSHQISSNNSVSLFMAEAHLK